ncbi:MAG: aminotransferase class V-fold PLP-dependent enzyme, partial [Candidatus Bathyarchaeia archaeon]
MGVYEELGVRRVVNASGNMTDLGGSLMDPETLEAMNDAAGSFVYMEELMEKAGEVIAEVTGAEKGLVTSGAAAALALAAAACMTGKDLSKVARLPDTTGMKNEIIIQRMHRNPFDSCVRVSGAKFVEVGHNHGTEPWELEAAINEKTAAIIYFVFDPQPGVLPLEEVIKIGKKYGIPVIVDAAAEVPPVENLKKFIAMGADLVLFSGGKEIRGPNDSGILCGRSDLIEAAALNAFPKHFGWFGIGRPMKISKE